MSTYVAVWAGREMPSPHVRDLSNHIACIKFRTTVEKGES
jgi:hypothetical protein